MITENKYLRAGKKAIDSVKYAGLSVIVSVGGLVSTITAESLPIYFSEKVSQLEGNLCMGTVALAYGTLSTILAKNSVDSSRQAINILQESK